LASNFIAYLDSVKARDPAARSRWEVLLYPGAWALMFHRVAHWLYGGRLFWLARFVNHFARLLTAIDIHPGARRPATFLPAVTAPLTRGRLRPAANRSSLTRHASVNPGWQVVSGS